MHLNTEHDDATVETHRSMDKAQGSETERAMARRLCCAYLPPFFTVCFHMLPQFWIAQSQCFEVCRPEET